MKLNLLDWLLIAAIILLVIGTGMFLSSIGYFTPDYSYSINETYEMWGF